MKFWRGDDVPRLQGKVVIVTGSAHGLGLTMAEAYGRAGARVALFDRDEVGLTIAASMLESAGASCLALTVDLRNEQEIDAAVAQVLERCGAIDVLVNNAALLSSFIQGEQVQGQGDQGQGQQLVQREAAGRVPFWEVDPDRWRELWEVNVTGLWLCTRRISREMIARRSGSIINLTTTSHIMTSDAHIPYGPSKAAVDAFTRAGALQLKPYGVRMNALLPGAMVSPGGSGNDRFFTADVIVPAALYLASERSSRVTGQSIIAEEYIREHGLLPPGSPRAD